MMNRPTQGTIKAWCFSALVPEGTSDARRKYNLRQNAGREQKKAILD